jgi:hypothetical protein
MATDKFGQYSEDVPKYSAPPPAYQWAMPTRPSTRGGPAHFFLSGSGIAPSAGPSVSSVPSRPVRLRLERDIEWPGEEGGDGGYQEGNGGQAPPPSAPPSGGAPVPPPSSPSSPPFRGSAIPGVDPRMDGGSEWPRKAASRVLEMTLAASEAALG